MHCTVMQNNQFLCTLIIHHIHQILRYRRSMAGKEKTFVAVLVALLFISLFPSPTTAQGGVPGTISMECGDDPEVIVKPGQSSDMASLAARTLICTVTNDGSIVAESVEITNEFGGGPIITMTISEDSFSLEPGDTQEFTATFSASDRAAVVQHEFTITATVTAWGPIPVDGTILSNTANHTGDVAIKPYGMVTLDMPDKSSRNMETSQEISITFQVENDGNDVDTIDIRITNANELTQLGFVIQSGEYIQAKDVQSDGVSDQLSFIIRAPSEAATEIRNQIVIEASSTIDDSKDVVDFDLIVAAEEDSAGLGAGLSEVSTDDLAIYGAVGGGILLLIFLLVIIGRVSKRSSRSKVATAPPSEPPIEIEDEDDLDFDLDLDDLDFPEDDLDSMLDDL